jgi:hypothetical protein
LKTIIAALAGASLLAAGAQAAAQSHHGGWSHDTGGASATGGGWAHGSGGTGGTGGGWTHGTSGVPAGASGAATAPSAGMPGGVSRSGFPHGTFAGSRTFDHDFHHHFRSFPVFVGGFGFGLGLAAFDPWFLDSPFYGYWAPYPYYAYGYAPYGPPPPYYTPPVPRGEAAPPPAAQPPAACGSWAWDSVKQVYNWIPCAT